MTGNRDDLGAAILILQSESGGLRHPKSPSAAREAVEKSCSHTIASIQSNKEYGRRAGSHFKSGVGCLGHSLKIITMKQKIIDSSAYVCTIKSIQSDRKYRALANGYFKSATGSLAKLLVTCFPPSLD